MQVVFESNCEFSGPWVFLIPKYMGRRTTLPPRSNEQVSGVGYVPQTHGNWAQWAAPAVALLIGIVSVSLMVYFRIENIKARVSDDHTNVLIDAKLNPLMDKVNDGIDQKLLSLNSKVDDLAQRIASIEGELKGFVAQKYIGDSAAYAVRAKTALAVKAVQQATSALASATEEKLPNPPEYFVKTIGMIDGIAHVSTSPELSPQLQDARVCLARYRSSLITVAKTTYIGMKPNVRMMGAMTLKGDNNISGGYLDISAVPGDGFIGAPTGHKLSLSDNIRFVGTFIGGGTQTIDGIHWINVTFIGTEIRYTGGELDLEHVTFAGCTFEAPANERGERFAEYVALQLPILMVK
jgi:hypothetical protein